MRLMLRSWKCRAILAAVILAVLGPPLYRLYFLSTLPEDDYPEVYYQGQSVAQWAAHLHDWRLGCQIFVGSCTVSYPCRVKPPPSQYGPNQKHKAVADQADEQCPALLQGDPDAQPVLLALLRGRRNYLLHDLAIYGLVAIQDKTPETKAALVTAAENSSYARGLISELSSQFSTDAPPKLVIYGGEAAPKQP